VPFKNTFFPFIYAIFLNYVVLSSALVLFARLLISDNELFTGFVMIAAAPVGLSVVPFTYMLKGNISHSIIGVLAIYLSSIILAPVIVNLFLDGVEFQTWQLFITMIELVILPLAISRLLMWKLILKKVEQIRRHIVNWGFAFVIFTVVGINREVFFSEYLILLRIIIVLFICIFMLSWIYEKLMYNWFPGKGNIIADLMILTTKSSGFSAVTAMTFYGERAAIPSAVLSIMVLLFLFYKSYSFK
jgi:bile acid:Na+ symporter, BASS family